MMLFSLSILTCRVINLSKIPVDPSRGGSHYYTNGTGLCKSGRIIISMQ